MSGKAWRGSSISFGEFGLKAMECALDHGRGRLKPPAWP